MTTDFIPVQGGTGFQDPDSLYQFVFEMKPYVPLCKALGFNYDDADYDGHKLLADAVERLGLSPGQQSYIHKIWSGKHFDVLKSYCNNFDIF